MDNENSKIGGFAIDVFEEIFNLMPNYTFRTSLMDWETCLSSVKRGSIDGILMLVFSSERTKYFLFSDELIATSTLKIYYNKSKYPTGIEWNTLSDLKKYRFGMLEGISFESEFDPLVKSKDYSIEYVNDSWLNFKKLAAKRVDVVVDADIYANYYIRSLGIGDKIYSDDKTLGSYPFYSAISNKSKHKHLIKDINFIIKKLKENGTIKKLSKQYQLYD